MIPAIALGAALCCAGLLILMLRSQWRVETMMLNDPERVEVAAIKADAEKAKAAVEVLEAANANLEAANAKLLEVNAELTARLGDGTSIDPAITDLGVAVAAIVPAAPANDPTPPPAAA